jgi:hypothetical protein
LELKDNVMGTPPFPWRVLWFFDRKLIVPKFDPSHVALTAAADRKNCRGLPGNAQIRPGSRPAVDFLDLPGATSQMITSFQLAEASQRPSAL